MKKVEVTSEKLSFLNQNEEMENIKILSLTRERSV
jgi:hypothetical protein